MRNVSAIEEKSIKRLVKLLVNFQFVYIVSYALCPLGERDWFTFYSSSRLENIFFAFFDFMGVSYLMDTPTYNSSWWYMSMAITLILILPLLIKLYRHYGTVIFIGVMFLAYEMNLLYEFLHYIPSVFMGVILGEKHILERIAGNVLRGSILKQILVSLSCAATTFILMWSWPKSGWYVMGISEAIICCGISLFTVLTLGRIPGLSGAADFVGKHSMNMYFIHVFIFDTWFKEFTYSLKYPALIFLFLFTSSLVASIVIEKAKSLLRIKQVETFISSKVCGVFVVPVRYLRMGI